jgi:hypothetical protein
VSDRLESTDAADATPRTQPTDSTVVTDPADRSDPDECAEASAVPDHARGYPASPPHRRRAVFATFPFLLLGLAIVAFGVVASPRPLFGFLIFPPVVFVSILTYVAFRSRFEADAE